MESIITKLALNLLLASTWLSPEPLVVGEAAPGADKQHTPGYCPHKTSVLLTHHDCPLAVDEHSPTSAWNATWTHQPQCIADGDGYKFCVYTNAASGPRGVSIVTQPDTGADAAAAVRQLYASTYPSRQTVVEMADDAFVGGAYEMRDMDGRGKGLVARRLIREGETFIVDFAALLTDVDFRAFEDAGERSRLLSRAVRQLVAPSEVLQLARRSSADDEEDVEDIMGINSFEAKIGGTAYEALYPTISRINHDCRPNSYFRWGSNGLRAGIAALHDIQPGEEITISYIPMHLPLQERHNLLTHQWGFTCRCALCSDNTTANASDANLAALMARRDDLGAAVGSGDAAKGVEALLAMLHVLEKEGLPLLYQETHEQLARAYGALGQMEEMRRHVRLMMGLAKKYAFLDPREMEEDLDGTLRAYGMA